MDNNIAYLLSVGGRIFCLLISRWLDMYCKQRVTELCWNGALCGRLCALLATCLCDMQQQQLARTTHTHILFDIFVLKLERARQSRKQRNRNVGRSLPDNGNKRIHFMGMKSSAAASFAIMNTLREQETGYISRRTMLAMAWGWRRPIFFCCWVVFLRFRRNSIRSGARDG